MNNTENKITIENLKDKLNNIKYMLNSPADSFGPEIAIALRTILHDTKQSESLLTILNLKKELFLSTKTETTNNRANKKDDFFGLVRMIKVGVNDGYGGEVKYHPLYDEKYFKSKMTKNMLNFEDWWDEEILGFAGKALTRKLLITTCANKDGGAHFDRNIPEDYDIFRNSQIEGGILRGINSNHIRNSDNAPHIPTIKQIAYEVIETFRDITGISYK